MTHHRIDTSNGANQGWRAWAHACLPTRGSLRYLAIFGIASLFPPSWSGCLQHLAHPEGQAACLNIGFHEPGLSASCDAAHGTWGLCVAKPGIRTNRSTKQKFAQAAGYMVHFGRLNRTSGAQKPQEWLPCVWQKLPTNWVPNCNCVFCSPGSKLPTALEVDWQQAWSNGPMVFLGGNGTKTLNIFLCFASNWATKNSMHRRRVRHI